MNIFSKIRQLKDLTNTEQVVADYVLESPEEVITLDVKELSSKCYVSTSTIYRFIDKLGLQGYSEFKVMISSQYQQYKEEVKETDYNYPFEKQDTHYQIATKMSLLYEQTIASTKNLLDLDNLLKIIQLLDKAKRIVLFPTVGNKDIAEIFQQNMKEIAKDVEVEVVPYLQYITAASLTPQDLAIVISYANRGTAVIDIVQELKKQGTPIVLVSSTLPTELFSYATYHLYVCPYENSEEKIASFSSRISLHYLLDTLYACYFNRDYDKNLDYRVKHVKTF